jgi:hypothetical protein
MPRSEWIIALVIYHGAFTVALSSFDWDLQEVRGDRGDWMELAQDRDRWRVLVDTVRDFRVP